MFALKRITKVICFWYVIIGKIPNTLLFKTNSYQICIKPLEFLLNCQKSSKNVRKGVWEFRMGNSQCFFEIKEKSKALSSWDSLPFLCTKVWLIVRAENEWKQIMTPRTQLLINFHKFWWHFTPILCKVKDTFNNEIWTVHLWSLPTLCFSHFSKIKLNPITKATKPLI